MMWAKELGTTMDANEMPAGALQKSARLLGVYRAMKAWSNLGGRSADWIKSNPDAYRTVTQVIKMQRESNGAA